MSNPIKTLVQINGMTCGSCRRRVEDALAAVPAVDRVRVDLQSGVASVYSFEAVDEAGLLQAVRSAGYHATLIDNCELV